MVAGPDVVRHRPPMEAALKILVTVKRVPDTAAEKRLDPVDKTLDRESVETAAIRQVEPDIVLCGSESTDARTSLVPSALAEKLGWPGLTGAKQLEVDGSTVRVHRETENGYDVLEADGPAVVSVVKGINEPRYPSFKGIMAAKSKPVTDYTLADLGIDPGEVGAAGATTEVVDFTPRPPRQAGQQVKDPGDGSAAVELAEFLASHKFI
jgi:electron transfer flavoprotein beta subunit